MIETLHIKNIGIIDDITLDLKNGFNVLTGETGSGKSLIINSIDIISGGRFSKDMIRKGQDFCLVEACIFLDDAGISDEEKYIIVSREINVNGRNLCKINGKFVTVSELKNYMKNIIDIHGQYDNQSLMDSKTHLNFLDKYCSQEISELLYEYNKLYDNYIKIKKELDANYGDDIEKQRKLDLLNYQLNEIKEADLKLGEEESLNEKKIIFKNYEKIVEALNISSFKLENNILMELENVIKPLEKISSIDQIYENKLVNIQNVYYELEEQLRDINEYQQNLEFDEEECKYVQDRMDLIFSLKRKYGNSIEEILKYSKCLEEEIHAIKNLDNYINNLKMKLDDIKENMYDISDKINIIRKKYATILENTINEELKELEMSNAIFKVDINYDTKKDFTKYGLNSVEFLINTNVGEDFKPLVKIASGGEISRVMLAIKSVLCDVDEVSTIVFDEIDTGISGFAVKAVSEKIKKISKKHQVIAVTHQPILTASADHNYKINKIVDNGKTFTTVIKLSENELINEIAKISNGEITNTALKNAIELRKLSIA